MTTQQIKQTSIEFVTVCQSDLIPRLALAASFLLVTGLVFGLL